MTETVRSRNLSSGKEKTKGGNPGAKHTWENTESTRSYGPQGRATLLGRSISVRCSTKTKKPGSLYGKKVTI